ncbi:hypothetical protein [Pseudonocardia adelaidensis]|uniref:SnoaL-like protein n=1 Tax=Pseudonocardia adelaidensis TaxID=648754 RepID=A0ABP9NP43_9PSEU
MSNPDVQAVAESYVAQWNEPDPAARHERIRELWADDALHVLVNPLQAVRDAAASLAVPAPSLEVRGLDALEARVARAHEMFVAAGEHHFEADGVPTVLTHRVIGVRWSMVATAGGETVGGGLDVLALDDDGRIRTDHQYVG